MKTDVIDEALEGQDGIEEVAELVEREPDEPKADADKDKKPDVVAAADHKRLQRELKEERRLRKEHEENAHYWADQARLNGRAQPAADPDPEPEEEIDLVSELTTNGVKGFEKIAKKLGFAKREEVLREINSTRTEITEQAELLRQFPGLSDDTSPLFKATAAIYTQLSKDPILKQSPKLIAIAARTAQAELGTGGRRRNPIEPDPEEEDLGNEEEDLETSPRAARIARQSGDRGRRPATGKGGGQPEQLSTLQREMVKRFVAAGADITEEGYMKRALSGVRMGGRSGRR